MAKHGNKNDISLLFDAQMCAKNLSAKELADACGVSEQTVNHWRNGSIPKSSMKKVASSLDLSIEELLTGKRQLLDNKAEGRVEKKINALSFTTGTSLCIVIGAMMMFVAMYVTCTINMLFGAELEHSVGYFAWTVVSAISAFGGAYLAISGLRTAKKAGVAADQLTR